MKNIKQFTIKYYYKRIRFSSIIIQSYYFREIRLHYYHNQPSLNVLLYIKKQEKHWRCENIGSTDADAYEDVRYMKKKKNLRTSFYNLIIDKKNYLEGKQTKINYYLTKNKRLSITNWLIHKVQGPARKATLLKQLILQKMNETEDKTIF